jgi:hypothetical protein
VARGAGDQEPITAKLDDRDLRASRRVGDNAEIDVAAEHLIVNAARTIVLEVDVHLREVAEVSLERLGQLVEADAMYRTDAHATGHDVAEALQLRLHFVERVNDRPPDRCRISSAGVGLTLPRRRSSKRFP